MVGALEVRAPGGVFPLERGVAAWEGADERRRGRDFDGLKMGGKVSGQMRNLPETREGHPKKSGKFMKRK